MAFKEKQMPLKANNNAAYKKVDGVTYFKLKSEFDGDYTKHCGLLGEEIDENFYFLRGYDIDSIDFNDKGELVIQRVDRDYDPIVIPLKQTIEHPQFVFNKEEGTIIVTYPNGTVQVMDGFLVEGKSVKIATDSTLDGNGTIFNPLKISGLEKTGTLAAADSFLDRTSGLEMPTNALEGDRIVTKEKIDLFGRLYTYNAVEKIQKVLNEKDPLWRIPSKEDWDNLLNALECPEDKNHSASTCTWLGKIAGSGLKSSVLWEEYPTTVNEIPVERQENGIDEFAIYPLGVTPDRNQILNENDYDVEGFGKIAGMWTSTKNDEGKIYAKTFAYDKANVGQNTYNTNGARMSLRFIKNTDNFESKNGIETILGLPYTVETIIIKDGDTEYKQTWTTMNAYFDDKELDGAVSKEWDVVNNGERGIKTVYFINEWNGKKWEKRLLTEGESIVILNYENKPYHEWRVINGELIDTAEALVEEFKKDFDEIRENIAELSATTKELVEFSGWVVETINEFSAATEEHINRIDATVTEISGKVDELSATTEAFSAATVTEIERLDADVAFVSGEVVTLSAATVAEVARLDGKIDELSATTESFSAATVAEIERLDGKDLVPDTYVLDGDASSEMVIPTYSDEIADVKIKVSDDFFNFGEF